MMMAMVTGRWRAPAQPVSLVRLHRGNKISTRCGMHGATRSLSSILGLLLFSSPHYQCLFLGSAALFYPSHPNTSPDISESAGEGSSFKRRFLPSSPASGPSVLPASLSLSLSRLLALGWGEH